MAAKKGNHSADEFLLDDRYQNCIADARKSGLFSFCMSIFISLEAHITQLNVLGTMKNKKPILQSLGLDLLILIYD